jgi:hypothetical protein
MEELDFFCYVTCQERSKQKPTNRTEQKSIMSDLRELCVYLLYTDKSVAFILRNNCVITRSEVGIKCRQKVPHAVHVQQYGTGNMKTVTIYKWIS